MSNRQISSFTSPVYSYTFPAMVSGSASSVLGAIPNFNNTTSRILGASPTVAASNDLVFCNIANDAPVGGTTPLFPVLRITSSNNASTRIYKIYWVNEIADSPFFVSPNQIKAC